MNDFGEMSISGAVLSDAEMRESRIKRGQCETCGQKCFNKSLFKQTPINVEGRVLNGRCLVCHPLEANEMEVLTAEVNVVSSGDNDRATISGTRRTSTSPAGELGEMNRDDGGHMIDEESMLMALDSHGQGASLGDLEQTESVHIHANGRNKQVEERPSLPKDSSASQRSLASERSQFNPRSMFTRRKILNENETHTNDDSTSQQSRRGLLNLSSRFFGGSQSSLHTTRTSDSSVSSRRKRQNAKNSKDSKLSSAEYNEMKALQTLEEDSSVEEILDIAAAFPRSKVIQEKAMYLLANATYNISKHELDKLNRQIDDLRIVMDCMDSFPSEQELQNDCCSTLRNLCTLSAEIQSFVAQNGGINSVLVSMETFHNNVHLQQAAIEILCELGEQTGAC